MPLHKLSVSNSPVIFLLNFKGERKLKELQSMVGIIPRKQTQSSSGSTNNDDEGSYYDPDSWMNIKDEDDKRGRVGVQWPWQRSD